MKLKVILVLCLVATVTFAQENSKRQQRRNERLEDRMLDAREGGIDERDDEYDQVEIRKHDEEQQQQFKNPCNRQKCKRGEICQLKDADTAECVCQTCDEESDNVIKVCSTKNVTYNSECELDRDHCLCKHGLEGCSDNEADKVRLDYFAACKELTKCPDEEFNVFPERMRNWLFRIMKELDDRMDLGYPGYRDMLVNAREDEFHTEAVIWKFCDLDTDPEDRQVTRRELMYIIASVKPMEHCLVKFLNHCDEDDDNSISLAEWGKCLNVHTEHLRNKCPGQGKEN